MLIKYRSGVVYSASLFKHKRRNSKIISRSIVHMRSSFTLKRPISSRPLTIPDNQSAQTTDLTDKIDEYSPTLTLSDIFAYQSFFFMFLFFIGSACELSVVFSYRSRFPSTYFTYADLAKIKKFSASNCYNVTDLLCSLQTSINFYFIMVKCLLVYYSSILIGMIYVFHCTVRSSSCLLSLYIIIVIIFGTDFILFFDCIFSFIGGLFFPLLTMFMFLEVFLPHNVDDPLGKICGFNVSEGSLYEFLENDTSKSARFYRWVQKMKKQWSIKEEKLILTAIAVVITIIGITIHFIYCSSPSSSEKKLHL